MDSLQTEARNPASMNLDELTPLQFVHLMAAEDARVVPAVASQAEAVARAIEVIADRLRQGGRLVYAGAGTSGRLGVLDATECPPTFSAPPGLVIGLIAGGPQALTQAVEGAEDHPEFAARDLDALGLSDRDVLVGIATSGRTPYVLGALAHARRLGAFTIGLACNADAELIGQADLAITPVVGPEVLSGSTRLNAGTATKLVLNMLSTGAMVRLGKTFGNLMVDSLLVPSYRVLCWRQVGPRVFSCPVPIRRVSSFLDATHHGVSPSAPRLGAVGLFVALLRFLADPRRHQVRRLPVLNQLVEAGRAPMDPADEYPAIRCLAAAGAAWR
jgi:N-acetylmuramic acid 6-phosphate etherase